MSAQQAEGWTRRRFLGGLTLAGTAELLSLHARPVAAEPTARDEEDQAGLDSEYLSGPPVCGRRTAAQRRVHRGALPP
jgi:hypothetical protein